MEFFVDCNQNDRGLSLTLPAQTGTGDLIWRRGTEGPFVIARNFQIVPGAASTCSSDTDCGAGQTCSAGTCSAGGGGEIRPSDSTPGATTPTCVDDADCASGRVCHSGSCVAGTTPTPTPTSCHADSECTGGNVCRSDHTCGVREASSTPTTFGVSLDGSDAIRDLYGFAHVNYQIQGGGTLRAKYVYFPTSRADCSETVTGTTHEGLVTDPNGHALVEGAPVYATYHPYNSGTACVEADGNCRDWHPDAHRSATFCRVELSAASGTFYVKLAWPGKYTLVAQGEDGTWRSTTHEFTLERPSFSGVSVTVSDREPKIELQANATHTVQRLAVMGCLVTTMVNDVSSDGRASITGSCPFQKDATVSIVAMAMGDTADNVLQQYRIHCEAPQPNLRLGGEIYAPGARDPGGVLSCSGTSLDHWWESCNTPVDLTFYASVTRACTVSKLMDDGSWHDESSVTVPWVRDLQVKAFAPVGTRGGYGPPEECGAGDVVTSITTTPIGPVRLGRTHHCTQYAIVGHDTDGSLFQSDPSLKSFPFPPHLSLEGGADPMDRGWTAAVSHYNSEWQNAACQYTPDHNGGAGGGWPGGNQCDNTDNWGTLYARRYHWNWSNAQNCKRLYSTCGHTISYPSETDGVATYQTRSGAIDDRQIAEGRNCQLVCESWDPVSYPDVSLPYGYSDCDARICVMSHSCFWFSCWDHEPTFRHGRLGLGTRSEECPGNDDNCAVHPRH